MTKRTVCSLLCALLALSLCACSTAMTPSTTASPAPTATLNPTTQPTDAPTPAPTEAPTEAPAESAAPAMQPDMENVPPLSQAQDGVYTARMSDAYTQEEGHGWQTTLTLQIEGGVIVSADFDAFQDGKRKSELSTEEYPMNPPASEWIPELATQIEAASAPGDIDGVSGATNASDEARKLFAAILIAAADGNTEDLYVE